MSIDHIKEMFSQMVLKKDVSLIPKYYHQDFILYTNEEKMDYAFFFKMHESIYNTAIQYQVEYDDETLLEQDNKVAGRVWITVTKPNESPKKMEIILIAKYKEDKIYRLWELTYPDWSKLPEFK